MQRSSCARLRASTSPNVLILLIASSFLSARLRAKMGLVAKSFLVAVGSALALAGAGHGGNAPVVQVRDPTWSPDGTELAYVQTTGVGGRVSGQLREIGFDGRAPRRLTPVQPLPYGISWSPDGRSIAYASG